MQQQLPVWQEQQLKWLHPSQHRPVPPPLAQLQLGIRKSMEKPLLSKQLPQGQQSNGLQLQERQRRQQVLLHV